MKGGAIFFSRGTSRDRRTGAGSILPVILRRRAALEALDRILIPCIVVAFPRFGIDIDLLVVGYEGEAAQ